MRGVFTGVALGMVGRARPCSQIRYVEAGVSLQYGERRDRSASQEQVRVQKDAYPRLYCPKM